MNSCGMPALAAISVIGLGVAAREMSMSDGTGGAIMSLLDSTSASSLLLFFAGTALAP
jgi:hypothetical protein